MEIREMTTPGNPPANSGRLYVADDGGTTSLYFRDSAGTETDITAGGGADTGLTNLSGVAINTSLISDTDDTDDLGSSSIRWRDLFLERNIRFGVGGQVRATEPTIWADASGDMVYNVATGDRHFWTVNAVTVASLDATDLELEVPLELNSNDLQYSGTGNKLAVTGSTHVITANSTEIFRYNDATFRLANQLDMQDNEIILDEMGTAPTGASNAVKIYAEDNGGGKTRLMAIFPTGAAQQIAIEP
jgi:hypothetical protein